MLVPVYLDCPMLQRCRGAAAAILVCVRAAVYTYRLPV